MTRLALLGILPFLAFGPTVNAQEQEWELDKLKKREAEKSRALDSLLVHLEDRWELKLAYGRWFFSQSARSRQEELFFLPNQLALVQLMGNWHFSEQAFAHFGFGIQIKRDIPPTPNLFSVLSGDDIDLEGSGTILLPLELGINYYLTQTRFRPVVGFNLGTIWANGQYTLAEGNLSNGVERTDFNIRGNALFSGIRTGFDYRSGKRTNLGLTLSYSLSEKFNDPVGGFFRYQGTSASISYSLIFGVGKP